MCGSERKFSSVAAALDMLLPQKIVSFICNSQRTIGLCRPSSCVYQCLYQQDDQWFRVLILLPCDLQTRYTDFLSFLQEGTSLMLKTTSKTIQWNNINPVLIHAVSQQHTDFQAEVQELAVVWFCFSHNLGDLLPVYMEQNKYTTEHLKYVFSKTRF